MFEFRWRVVNALEVAPENAVMSTPALSDVVGTPALIHKYIVLQERHVKCRIDAGGAINVLPLEWTEWTDVVIHYGEHNEKDTV